MLEGASKAEFLNLIRPLRRDVLFEHLDCASGLVEQPADTVECGGLAAAVRPDEAYELTRANFEGDVLNSNKPAELLA